MGKLKDHHSAQVIIPQKQVGRRNDIYMSLLSNAHCVSAKGKYLAICSTTVETDKPAAELGPARALLDKLIVKFDNVVDMFTPVDDGRTNKCFISKSLDATSHFESVSADILDLYERITGESLDLDAGAAGGAGK